MLEELLKEITELKEYKKKYEYCLIEKQRMSDKLYRLMILEYGNTTPQQNIEEYKKHTCCDCRFQEGCHIVLPQDIGKPIKNDEGWIPATKSCESFSWD